jgi:hypothetical protein
MRTVQKSFEWILINRNQDNDQFLHLQFSSHIGINSIANSNIKRGTDINTFVGTMDLLHFTLSFASPRPPRLSVSHCIAYGTIINEKYFRLKISGTSSTHSLSVLWTTFGTELCQPVPLSSPSINLTLLLPAFFYPHLNFTLSWKLNFSTDHFLRFHTWTATYMALIWPGNISHIHFRFQQLYGLSTSYLVNKMSVSNPQSAGTVWIPWWNGRFGTI